MRRSWPILMAITALLAGCSSGSSTPATVTVTESPAASASLDDTVKEVGFFSQQFHPCEAFTEEQLERAGLGKRSNAAENPESVVKACGFGFKTGNENSASMLLATDKMSWEKITDLNLEPKHWERHQINEVYIHKMPGDSRQCVAAVDLEWGRFIASYLETGIGWDRETLCTGPVAVLESLIEQSGGIDGT